MDVCLQNEAYECGLASLAMVANAYRLHISPPEIHSRFLMPLKGMKLSLLIQIVQQVDFAARPLRLEMGCLRHCESDLNSPIQNAPRSLLRGVPQQRCETELNSPRLKNQ
ncbi:cysteine peptidase family C39 domain-containing protein [Xanthomonas oryzae]|nr:cysteine peptidase family C39 domain-containing protein [Xanthomonas oryzae]